MYTMFNYRNMGCIGPALVGFLNGTIDRYGIESASVLIIKHMYQGIRATIALWEVLFSF